MEDEPKLALSKLVIPLILAFTEPSCRLQISVKSLERKEGTFLATKQFPPTSDIVRAGGRRKYLIYFSNDIEPNQRIAIVQHSNPWRNQLSGKSRKDPSRLQRNHYLFESGEGQKRPNITGEDWQVWQIMFVFAVRRESLKSQCVINPTPLHWQSSPIVSRVTVTYFLSLLTHYRDI